MMVQILLRQQLQYSERENFREHLKILIDIAITYLYIFIYLLILIYYLCRQLFIILRNSSILKIQYFGILPLRELEIITHT
jgi:hypothetical protein